jgi:membrane protease YdiL (CAAX protease family)
LHALWRVPVVLRYVVSIVVPAAWWGYGHFLPNDPPSITRMLLLVAEGCAYGAIARVGGLELTIMSHALINFQTAIANGLLRWPLPIRPLLF